MPTANETARDLTIRHAVYLERLKNGLTGGARRRLNREILPALQRAIIDAVGTGDLSEARNATRRLAAIRAAIRAATQGVFGPVQDDLVAQAQRLLQNEAKWTAMALSEAAGVTLAFNIPDARTLNAAFRARPFAGFTLDEWFNSLEEATRANITRVVQQGMVEGSGVAEIARRLRGTRALGYTDGVLEVTRRQSEAIVRSAVTHVSSAARQAMFDANDDIIEAFQFVATLDSRTTTLCASLDGKVFPKNKGPRPPLHVNCRSSLLPVLKSASEIGIKDIPASTRASMDGAVPASTTYGEWLRGQPVSVQNSVLGKAKAKLFRDGGLKIDQFVGKDLGELTLDQLEGLYKGAFEKAGLV
jgi:SPP1 gp7 family putative phage head morphogenesis protein